MTSLPATTHLDRYDLLQSLGEGTYGSVFEVRERTTGQRLAIKKLTHTSPIALARFKREFRALQSVHHPNLVRLEALFEKEGCWMIAMELVEGEDLLSYLYKRPRVHYRDETLDESADFKSIQTLYDPAVEPNQNTPLPFEEARLRHVFYQLALGLSALHRSGIVHRDLKPSNILVTSEERVVLLDFGMATTLDPKTQSNHATPTGTAAYMAPEQALDKKLSPAADWYAFGVCLYEVMTGVLPIDAQSVIATMMAKQTALPPPPSSRQPNLPPDLEKLCMQLLQPLPEKRASEETVLGILADRDRNASKSILTIRPKSFISFATEEPPFAGREHELGELDNAVARVRSGKQQIVLVQGESGIGKSALVERFLTHIQNSESDALILHSRCYENELLAYKAFDGAIDDLSKTLAALDMQTCLGVLPPRAALLCRLFPVLALVKSIAKTKPPIQSMDPTVQRLEAFSVLVQLLYKLCQTQLVVINIDDLQWADVESFRLLRAIVEDGQAPALLIIATIRPLHELKSEVLEGLTALSSLGNVNTLSIEGLPPVAAQKLTRELLGPQIPDQWLDTIARESRGHPLFLTLLARFVESHDPRMAAELTLEAALNARIGNLSKKAQALLDVVALAGSPQPIPLCIEAASLRESESGNLIAELHGQKMVRRRQANEIACFHDRIRQTVVQGLLPAQARSLHKRIAEALSALGETDPAELGRHYDAAGEGQLAFNAYRQGAKNMLDALAFARAAALYERAIEIGVDLALDASVLTQLEIDRGHALARGGRSADAAKHFLQASQHATDEARTQLRIWAAQNLLQSAQVEKGLSTVRDLLSDLGISLPRTEKGMIARLLWDRARMTIGGINVNTENKRDFSTEEMTRLHAMWGMIFPVTWVDPLLGSVLFSRFFRDALTLGEPGLVARALIQEAINRVQKNPYDKTADPLLKQARELSRTLDDPALEMFTTFEEGATAAYRWDTSSAQERFEIAEKLGTEHCVDQHWLLTIVRTNLGLSWIDKYDYSQLLTRIPKWIAQAKERDDHFAPASLKGLGFGFISFLIRDEPDLAREALETAMAPWPREPFSLTHFGELCAISRIELYRGGAGALNWFINEKSRLDRAFLLKVGICRAGFQIFRTFSALSAWCDAPRTRASELLEETRSQLRRLRRIDLPLAKQASLLVEAQLDAIQGRTERALEKTRTILQTNPERRIFLHRYAVYFDGLLKGGDAGHEQCNEVIALFDKDGWKNSLREIKSYCPTSDLLESKRR